MRKFPLNRKWTVRRYGKGGTEHDPWEVIATHVPPWKKRSINRRRNKAARKARRANR